MEPFCLRTGGLTEEDNPFEPPVRQKLIRHHMACRGTGEVYGTWGGGGEGERGAIMELGKWEGGLYAAHAHVQR